MPLTSNASRLSTLAAACLLSVSMPALPALAKEKVKTQPTGASEVSVDYDVSIPGIETVDSSLDEAVLEDILRGNLVDHAEELAVLDAQSITVPEITIVVTSDNDGETIQTTITLSEFALQDVTDGVAANVTLASIEMNFHQGDASFGAFSAADVDIGRMLGLFGLVDAGASDELKTVYTQFRAEGGSLTSEEVTCTFGPTSGMEFKARPLKTSFGEIMALAPALEEDADDVDPAVMAQLLRIYADFLTAFETSEVTYEGLSCDGEDDGQPLNLEIASMSVGPMTAGIYPSVSMDGFSMTFEDDGAISLDTVTFHETDFSNTIALLESAPDDIDESWFEQNTRAMLPAFGGMSFSGLAFDIADPAEPQGRINFGIGAFDLALADYINGIPADVDISASNIHLELPENTGDETVEQLRALGVTELDAGFRFSASWNSETQSIDFEEISVTGVDLATVVLAGTIANVTEHVFAADEGVALAAAMGAAVKSLNLNVVDEGLSDIVFAIAAEEQNSSPDSLRPIFAGLAQGTVISMLAGVADAAKLGEAVNAFVSGTARTLEIGIEAKTEPGLSAFDFMAAETDPASLLDKVNVSATAK